MQRDGKIHLHVVESYIRQGDKLLMFDFEKLIHPVLKKTSNVHLECVAKINQGRAWANKDFKNHEFQDSLQLVEFYKKRRGPVLPRWPSIDTDLAIVRAYATEEGDRVIEGRLLVMLPSPEDVRAGCAKCVWTFAWESYLFGCRQNILTWVAIDSSDSWHPVQQRLALVVMCHECYVMFPCVA